jgi:hypothetical protein
MKNKLFLSGVCFILSLVSVAYSLGESCKTSLDCIDSACCSKGVCEMASFCSKRINNSYLIIGLIGVGFISLAFVYFVITLRTVSYNVRKMKLKLFNLEKTEN